MITSSIKIAEELGIPHSKVVGILRRKDIKKTNGGMVEENGKKQSFYFIDSEDWEKELKKMMNKPKRKLPSNHPFLKKNR